MFEEEARSIQIAAFEQAIEQRLRSFNDGDTVDYQADGVSSDKLSKSIPGLSIWFPL